MPHLLFLALAATTMAQEPSAEDPSYIVNGEFEEGFAATVALGVAFGDRGFSTCTASVITPRILLTAAHCSEEFGIPVDEITEFGVAFFGPDVRDPDAVLRFASIENHRNYEGIVGFGTPMQDIGIIVLEEDAPVRPVIPRLSTLTDRAIGKTVTSVGYGATSGAGGGSGIKRSAELTVDELTEQFVVSYNGSNEDFANICSGDSGGPQYRKLDKGVWVQWGVHSYGDQNCGVQSGSTRTDHFGKWITNRVEEVHGTPDICEAAGYYEDGQCDALVCPEDPDCIEDAPPLLTACDATGRPAWGLAGLLGLLLLRRRR